MDYTATSKFEALRHPAYFLSTHQRRNNEKDIAIKIIVKDVFGRNNFSISKMFK